MEKDGFIKKAEELLSSLSIDEKLPLICTHQPPIDKLGLKELYIGTEIARGYVGRDKEKYSTVFPQPVGLAGTFDTELMAELGEIAGNEARAYWNADRTQSPCLWGPTVDLERHPLWGRTEEAYGEDVCLAGEMTRAYTEAMAGDNGEFVKTIPTLKHFCANNNEKDRGSCDSYLPLRLKYEYYYAAFMNGIKYGGAKSAMASYNEINGVPGLCNPELESILKNDWGMWFTVTDGGDFSQNVTHHRYCHSHAETLAEAIAAGCDVMTDTETVVIEAAKKALAEGLITETDIDKAARNVLYARLKLGELSDNCPYNDISLDVLNDKRSAEVALKAAEEQVVLLKNDGLLPLKTAPKKIAVIGPLADENLRDWYTGYFRNAVSPVEGIRREFPESEVIFDSMWDIISIKAPNGKYLSAHEDGTVCADADEVTESELFELRFPDGAGKGWDNLFSVKYKKYVTFMDETIKLGGENVYNWFTGETFVMKSDDTLGIENGFVLEEYLHHRRMTCSEDGKIGFAPNTPVTRETLFSFSYASRGMERCSEHAKSADLVVFCMGNDPIQGAKECYDRSTLKYHDTAALYLGSLNPNFVTVIISSFQYSVCAENEALPAILYTTHAGAHLGTAVARTISGKNNPAGRLAMTWYRSDLDLPDIMNYDIESCGLTYMYFKGEPLYPFGYGLSYSSFAYKGIDISAKDGGSLTARITVENTSDIDGDEVIQLYFTVPDSGVKRPAKKLCAFKRVHIKAHSEITAELTVKDHILQIYDVRRRRMITEGGTYLFMAGGSSAELPLTAEMAIKGEKLGARPDKFEAQSFDGGFCARIGWSRKLKRQYVYPDSWSGTVVYNGLSLDDKSSLKITASAIMGDGEIDLYIGKKAYSLKISATSENDEFREYTLPIEDAEGDTVVIVLKNNICLLDIEVE